jgi:hypothetical protein
MTVERSTSRGQPWILFLVALLASSSMWFYVQSVLIPYEKVDAAAHQRPRGNLSDLYPRWLGAHVLLRHHRNPYGDDITKEIQEGYFGRALDATRPNDPKDQQAFAYPVYVVFLLAPVIDLPFDKVKAFFHWLLIAMTAASVWLWVRVVKWRPPLLAIAAFIALTLGSFPAVQGIKLGQLSLVVALLLAGATACVTSGFLFCGGVLLALATIKPQLVWPLAAWLFAWAASDWRARRRLIFGFALAMAMLLAAAEIILPGWFPMFVEAIGKYHRYTQNQSVLDVLVPWGLWGKVLAAAAVLACAFVLWNFRGAFKNRDSAEFGRATALVMALTVLVVPMCAPYNQLLLLPAVLALARDRLFFVSRSRLLRFGYVAGVSALVWPWMASLALSAACLFASQSFALSGWWWPGVATFIFPVLVFVLMYVDVRGLQLMDSPLSPDKRTA